MFKYSFPAVSGVQANKQYFIAMVPLSLLPKIFTDYEEEVLAPEFRAQRRLNESRVPEIEAYILQNRDSYVFSALSASIDGSFNFKTVDGSDSIGTLEIDMGATILINDGQHRKAAIEAAIKEDETLCNETISIVFFKDEGLVRSQQMFTDLNKHAVKSSNSLATLYDSRDSLSVSTKKVVNAVQYLKRYTDLEHDILGKNSLHFFTLNSLKKANGRVLKSTTSNADDTNFLIEFWNCVFDSIDEWHDVLAKRMTKKDFRENYILTLSVIVNAFGRLGNFFYSNMNVDMQSTLRKLNSIDWLRSSDIWKGRIIREDGKIINTDEASFLACVEMKRKLEIPLSKEEISKEKKGR